jgi:carbonic anhydrase
VQNIQIIKAKTPEDISMVRSIFLDYINFIEGYLDHSLDFQNTTDEFSNFPSVYKTLLLAKLNNNPVAACALKQLSDNACELKRLYCRPFGRGHKIGESLVIRAIKDAKKIGYKKMYLDTNKGLKHANSIYEDLKFKDTDSYYANPMADTRYMSLTL